MIARANTLLATEVKSDGDYGKYPNWSQALKDQVAATIEELQNDKKAYNQRRYPGYQIS